MDSQTSDRTARIRELNDRFRTSFVGGVVLLTAGVEALSQDVRARVLQRLRRFDQFDEDNDPYGEHDLCAFAMDGVRYLAKIDHYDRAMEAGSEDPADPEKTTRVLTVMLAEEY